MMTTIDIQAQMPPAHLRTDIVVEPPAIKEVEPPDPSNTDHYDDEDLSAEDKRKLQDLKRKDKEVRRQEQIRRAVAGPVARGGPRYRYVEGPDGKKYAISGEIVLDTYFGDVLSNPEAALKKARRVRRAALSGNPSARDRQIASKATQVEAKARRILAQKKENQEARKEATYTEDGTPQEHISSFVDLFA
jgi:hypothetical protein